MAFLDKNGLERLWSQILSRLSGKVDKVEGKGLSTNDYTTEDKNKVENSAYKIHTHAEYDTKGSAEDALSQAKNYTKTQIATLITETEAREIVDEAVASITIPNGFTNVKVGSTTIVADDKTDTLTLVAGSNVTITPDATNDKITIAATDTIYTHPTSAGNKHIPSGGSSGQILRWSADGTAAWGSDNNTTYSAATQSTEGLMSADDKTKLDGISSGANKTIVDPTLSISGAAADAQTTRALFLSDYKLLNIERDIQFTDTTYILTSYVEWPDEDKAAFLVEGKKYAIILNNKIHFSIAKKADGYGYYLGNPILDSSFAALGDNGEDYFITYYPDASDKNAPYIIIRSTEILRGDIAFYIKNPEIEIDTTLAIEGTAADAKAVGDTISRLSASDVGALSLSGGTTTGDITVNRADGTSVIVSVTNGANKINLQVSDSGNKGIYNSTLAKWLVYANSDNEVRVNNTTQTVTSACLRNIKGGTAALTAGSSELASGEIYIQYE